METKKEILSKLRNSQQIYSLISTCTKMPYVVCDPQTYDDEVLLFYNEEDAKTEAKRLVEKGEPVIMTRVEHKFLLGFYNSLLSMGVNCLRIDRGCESETTIQLNELIKREKPEKTEENSVIIVENPEFTLTALYFLQGVRRKNPPEITEELKELYKEALVDFGKGIFIVAALEDQKLPTLSQKDGKVFQPVFTDIQEFFKFQTLQEKKLNLHPLPVKAEQLPGLLAEKVEGVVINPMGMNFQLFLKRKSDQ